MYRDRPWTMRQYAGFATAEETNARFRYLLAAGAPGLSTAFDLPTQLGMDSDDPLAPRRGGRGSAWRSTRSRTWPPVRRHPARPGLDQHDDQRPGGGAAAALPARGRGAAASDPASSAGTIQNDVLKEYVARGNYIYPPVPSMRLTTDTFAYCDAELPQWNTISISGYHIREAGSTAVQEVAFTLANGIAYVEAALAAGLDVDGFAPAAVVLLQRPQQPAGGGGEVPRRPRAVGAHHARPLRRHEDPRRWRCASTPRPAAHAHRPAAGNNVVRVARAGAGRGARRRPVDPLQRVRRGAGPARPRSRPSSRCAPSR